MDPSQNPNVFHATTIVCVRRGEHVAIAGDGQVTLGHTVMKGNARKVRRLGRDGQVLAGFAGAAAERVTGSLEDVARETMKPLQDAGQEFLSRFDQDELSNRVESILHQAADVTEQLLGALRAESASAGSGEKAAEGDVVDAEPDVVDGEVVDLGGAENAAGMAADVPAADEAADAAETVSAGDEAVADAMGGEKAAAGETGETDADKADDAGSTGGADETKGDAADR